MEKSTSEKVAQKFQVCTSARFSNFALNHNFLISLCVNMGHNRVVPINDVKINGLSMHSMNI